MLKQEIRPCFRLAETVEVDKQIRSAELDSSQGVESRAYSKRRYSFGWHSFRL